jgi:uncharacterized OB-fold protein
MESVERRHLPRRKTLKGGRIVFDDKRSVVDCTVTNMSEKGASLRLPSIVGIPDTFELHIGEEVHAVWVVWKKEGSLGVMWMS